MGAHFEALDELVFMSPVPIMQLLKLRPKGFYEATMPFEKVECKLEKKSRAFARFGLKSGPRFALASILMQLQF